MSGPFGEQQLAASALPRALVIAALALGALLPCAARDAAGEDDTPAATAEGEAVFDQAIRWLRGDRAAGGAITDFHADLLDVQFDTERGHHEGHMRIWLEAPDKYRLELRSSRIAEGPRARLRTTKILDGAQMWILDPGGGVQALHKSPEGQAAIAQMKQDRRRLFTLARFVTLEGFKGKGVTFVHEGSGKATAPLASAWLQVRRKQPGVRDMVFRFAYERAGDGGVVATHPLRVTVEGDPKRKRPTEVYDLHKWVRGEGTPFPTRIEAWSQAAPDAEREPFLLAHPRTVRVNAGVKDGLFAPPTR